MGFLNGPCMVMGVLKNSWGRIFEKVTFRDLGFGSFWCNAFRGFWRLRCRGVEAGSGTSRHEVRFPAKAKHGHVSSLKLLGLFIWAFGVRCGLGG